MNEKITIGQRGIVTLPAKLRKRYDLKEKDELIVEESPQGILLRPSMTIPIEMYTEQRIQEFEQNDDALGAILDRAK